MRKLFNLGNENLDLLTKELLLYIDFNKIEGLLSIKNIYKRNVALYTLIIDVLLLNRPDFLICIFKRQIEKGLTANQISTLRIFTTFLNECKRRDYF